MPNNQYKDTKNILIKGARVNNLKNISLKIPRNRFIVITGVSGSGKSSLAFDTLYAEGQRRYVESLSAYARQFLGRIDKPEVDFIKGIPPAIAIEQKVNTRNPRSTVGTTTEIYDYLKLLFSRIGKTISPVSGKEVKRHSVTDVVDFFEKLDKDLKALILAPLRIDNIKNCNRQLELLLQQGFTRIESDNQVHKISDILKEVTDDQECAQKLQKSYESDHLFLVIDRIRTSSDEDNLSRIGDSVQTAFYEGHGECVIRIFHKDKVTSKVFSNKFEADGISFEEPDVHTFSFNNPVGACPTCEGFGKIMGIDMDLVVPDKSKSVYEGAIACWKGDKMKLWKDQLVMQAHHFDFPVHRPYYELTDEQKELIWTGNEYFEGLETFFRMLENETYKIQYRVMLSRYRGKTTCPECKGTRLKKEASYVKIGGKSIHELVLMPVSQLKSFFDEAEFTDHDISIAKRLLIEIKNRLQFLCDTGLGYLTLNRLSSTLSGGESQRINLATSLGSSLVGSLYILDEPSIGLHTRDTQRLISVLKKLRALGNTVLVVEHDEEIIRAADYIIDIGPLAGRNGGEIVYQGDIKRLTDCKEALTTQYLTGKKKIPVPKQRRKWRYKLNIVHARENNLKHITVSFPLNILTVVTGVSGSGKSSLVKDVLYSALERHYNGYTEKLGKFDMLQGDFEKIKGVEFVNQNPIGKSSRSNPVTYLKAYDDIRKLFAGQHSAEIFGFKPGHFSFNVEGGRCEECQGEGVIKVEMQFMADVHLVCESCKGKKFKDNVLEVKYRGKNIYDVLEMTIEEAIVFFEGGDGNHEKRIVEKLQTLSDVGLDYIKLGQSSSTLSGGESQRIKLASFLTREHSKEKLLFIFDEPTTGLHFHDIQKLLDAFNALLEKGHSIIIIEHNPDIIKSADWIIDLGPEGGEQGGFVVCEGTPEKVAKYEGSYTGRFLKDKLQ